MFRPLAASVSVIMAMLLASCCAFVPCHRGTSLVGSVANLSGQPIASAKITLYGINSTSDGKGCFKMQASDGLPFTFVVTAVGHKSASVEAKSGFYRVRATLAPAQSPEQSHVEWFPLSASQYESSASCEP